MKQGHIIFNVVGITLALVFTVSGCGQLMGGAPDASILLTGLVVLLVGGGSMANLCERRLAVWPTVAMIVGYCISILLLPFGIWGVVALVMDRKRKLRRHR